LQDSEQQKIEKSLALAKAVRTFLAKPVLAESNESESLEQTPDETGLTGSTGSRSKALRGQCYKKFSS